MNHIAKYATTIRTPLTEKRSKPVDTHYVYFIRQDGTSLTKIGLSRNPNKRLSQIRTSSAQSLTLLVTFKASTRDLARILERRFHKFYANRRMSGEWFELTEQDVQYIMLMKDVSGCESNWNYEFLIRQIDNL